MKKYFITLLALIGICFYSSAQRIEIFGGYSYGSLVAKLPGITPPFNEAINAPMVSDSHGNNNGALTLGVNVRIIKNLSVGLSWTGVSKDKIKMHYYGSTVMDYVAQSSNAIMFNVKYDWLKFWKINLYSRAGIGAIFFSKPSFSEKLLEWDYNLEWPDGKPEACKRLAWQVSFVGVEYRPIKWIGIFAEGGLGRQGALLAGLKVFI
ncbi:MAG: hypothetical protein K2K88_00840 [Muribaculaceae bacterium]|nr:hypothetical protein [Muribaculaceae bacterium]MDE6643897.1 hypothetical protein [Muribaculaceae bacterium]